MDIIFLILGLLIVLLCVVNIIIASKRAKENPDIVTTEDLIDFHNVTVEDIKKSEDSTIQAITNFNNQQFINLKNDVNNSQTSLASILSQAQKNNQDTLNELVRSRLSEIQEGLARVTNTLEQRLMYMQQNTQDNLKAMREENSKKLDEIRGTVDEKITDTLNKRINDSFQTVSNQLEQVYKSIGEMQTLASEVGSLKHVLSGVKTRGILGEIQLGTILSDILTPEQYEENCTTIPGRSEKVEFAIKLPGVDGAFVYLPIDSKFPGTTYQAVLDARDAGDKSLLEAARKKLEQTLKREAQDIKSKYVEPPHTTAFGIMFLPFEGLYAEAVNMGMVEILQREYNVSICGPSTMAAYLNSLQMGFKTLAIQKRSNEVWKVLGEVKTEFGKFEAALDKMQTHLELTARDLDSLRTTRSNAISRKLRNVEAVEEIEATSNVPKLSITDLD